MTVKDIDSMSFDELKNEFIQFRKMMMDHISEQEKQIQDYKKKNEELIVNIKELQLELAIEKEKYKQVVATIYQSQKNQIALDMPTLFDDIEEVITVGEHTRVRRPKEQHLSYDHLPKADEYLSVPEGEDICEKYGSKMHIKKYQTKEELVYEPARLFVRVAHIPVLECENCQIYSEEGKSTYHTVTHHFLWIFKFL